MQRATFLGFLSEYDYLTQFLLLVDGSNDFVYINNSILFKAIYHNREIKWPRIT